MTVSSSLTRISYVGDGVSVNFAVPFGFYASTDLLVVLNGVTQTLATNYTVTGGLGSTGTVTMVVAPAATINLQIILNPPITQTVVLVDGTEFPASTLNQEADRAVQISLRLNDKITRSLRAPDGPDVAALSDMPTATARAGKYLGFDGSGQPTALSGTGNDSALRTDLANGASGPGSDLVAVKRSAAEIAAVLTPTVYSYAPAGQENADVRRMGAVGDGVTSDTTAFSNMLSALGNAVVNACRTAASYLVGAVSLTLPPNLRGGGKITLSGATAGFKLNANMAGPKFQDLEVVGDANTANTHRAVWNDGTKTISGVFIQGMYVHACVQNIDVSFCTDSVVIGNRVDSAAGNAAGQGYGLVGSKSKRTAFVANTLFANGRHSIYQSSVNYNVVLGNISYQNAGTGSSSAYPVTRLATGMAIVGNIAAEYVGTGMSIDADNSDGNGTCRAIQVVGQVFYQTPSSTNTNPDLAIGSSVPATNPLQTIAIRSNSFTPSPVRQSGFIVVTNGFNLDISDNIFDSYLGTVAGQIAINLDATAGAAYYDRIRICGNTGVLVSSGGATTFVSVGANICTGTQQVDIFNNTVTCGTLISYATTPTNPNIRTDSVQEQAITLAAGAQNLNISGYNRFFITGNGAGSTVNSISNGYEGKEITLLFADAFTTLARTNQYLSGSVNFVSVNRAIMKLVFRQGSWYELSRSLDG